MNANTDEEKLKVFKTVCKNYDYLNIEHKELLKYLVNNFSKNDTLYLHNLVKNNLSTGNINNKVKQRLNFIILNTNKKILQVFCCEHLIIFNSTWRYIKSTSIKLSGTCPKCDFQSGITKTDTSETPYSLNLKLQENNISYRIDLESMKVADRYSLVKSEKKIRTKCILKVSNERNTSSKICGRIKKHKVANLKTLLKGNTEKTIRCLGPCESSNRVKNKRMALSDAQKRLNELDGSKLSIDENEYNGYTSACTIKCEKCGIKYYLSPQYIVYKNVHCVCCGSEKYWPINIVAELSDLNIWLKKNTSWELSPDHFNENKESFLNKSSQSEFYVRCRKHKEVIKKINFASANKLLKHKYCCKKGQQESKQKYNINKLEEMFDGRISISLEKNNLKSKEEYIDGNKELIIDCPTHGQLEEKFTTYKLSRYNEYKTNTPCLECDPFSSNNLTYERIKDYVSSQQRLESHGALFELISDKTEINAQINDLKSSWKKVYDNIKIKIKDKNELNESVEKEIKYKDFVKGNNIFTNIKNKNLSHLHKVIYKLLSKYNIEFECERSFDNLHNDNGNPIKIDFYIPKLRLAIEIDGAQHISTEHQIKVKSQKEAYEKFQSTLLRDKKVDEYFESRKDKFQFKRVKAYKNVNNKIKSLSKKEAFNKAQDIVYDIYYRINGQYPEKLDIDDFNINVNTKNITIWEKNVSKVYNNYFTLIDITKNNELIVKCKEGHYIKIKFGTYYSLNQKNLKEIKSLCYGCLAENLLNEARYKLSEMGVEFDNFNDLFSEYVGSASNPVQKKLVKSNSECIIILNSKKIKLSLNEINKFYQQYKSDKANKIRVIKSKIINLSEVDNAIKEIEKYNIDIKKGRKTHLLEIPIIKFEKPIYWLLVLQDYKKLKDKISSLSGYELTTKLEQYYGPDTYVGIKHNDCNTVYFYKSSEIMGRETTEIRCPIKKNILNYQELKEYNKKVKDYNDDSKRGGNPSPPDFINLKFNCNSVEPHYMYKYIENSSQRLNEQGFTLIPENSHFYNPECYVCLKHTCGRFTFIKLKSLYSKLKKNQYILCSTRKCFEQISGTRLATNSLCPSREKTKPHNKIDFETISNEIKTLSNNTLELVPSTYKNVREPFYVNVIYKDSEWYNLYIKIGGHSNAKSKDVYRNHSNVIRNSSAFNHRVDISWELPNEKF